MKKEIKNPRLRDLLATELKQTRHHWVSRFKELRERAEQVDASLQKLSHLDLDWFGSDTLYIRLESATKAEFSQSVLEIAEALGEAPDVRLGSSWSEYMADFKDHRVHAFMRDPTDCKLIEVEETVTRKVLRPHPGCKAALQELEQAV